MNRILSNEASRASSESQQRAIAETTAGDADTMVAKVMTRPDTTDLLPFDETGILADENAEKYLLADNGGRYRLDYSGAISAGEWVRVRGFVDHACASVSCQIAGRVRRNGIEPVCSDFLGDGELEAGRETLLIRTDSGRRYIVNDSRDFRAGQRVRVAGKLIPLRVTLFDEGDGCLLNDVIEPCEEFAGSTLVCR